MGKYPLLDWTYSPDYIHSSSELSAPPPQTMAGKSPILATQIPSAQKLSSLLMMANMGDVQAILEELNILEKDKQIDPGFISATRKLAKEFDMKKVRDIINKHLPG
jgi:hypothetical protein